MHDKTRRTRARIINPLQNLTGRFITLYILLVFLPTVVFIGIYSETLARQQHNEDRYSKQLMLSQSASYMGNLLTQDEAFTSAFQADGSLMTLLEGGYSDPADELMACVQYVQPMITSVLASNPHVRDVYLYRYESSHVTNSDLVYNLPMIDQFPYDPALLAADTMVQRFLVTDPQSVRHLRDKQPDGAQHVSLIHIYNRSFSKVLGMVEVQVDIDRVLTGLDLTQNGGTLYLIDGDTGLGYPIRATANGTRLDLAAATENPLARGDSRVISEQVKGTNLSLGYVAESQAQGAGDRWRNVLTVALILLIPTTFVCVFVLRYVARLTRFGAHLHAGGYAALTPYVEEAKDDELGAVIRAYNEMACRIQALIEEVRQAEQLTNAATYYAMSSQVNPHFMFNTLENIRMQIEMENYGDAGQMLFVLGRFLRYNISLRRESVLSEELTHIEHYLMIYRYRASSLIHYTIEPAEDIDLAQVRCPFCMLQPIVENCIKHAIRDEEALLIRVAIRRVPDGLMITVADNGSGMTPEEIDALNASFQTPEIREQTAGAHVGLGNVNARVKFFYGPAYGLTLSPLATGGLEIAIHIGTQPEGSMP